VWGKLTSGGRLINDASCRRILREMSIRVYFFLLACASYMAAQPAYDLLLKNGHVIDPKNGVSRVSDVAIAGGKIARVAPDIPASQAKKTLDLQGLYVTPGLIDIHAHLYNTPGSPPL
jgi:dihydroorotase